MEKETTHQAPLQNLKYFVTSEVEFCASFLDLFVPPNEWRKYKSRIVRELAFFKFLSSITQK